MVIANDNTTIVQSANSIHVSNGETYMLSGRLLLGPKGIVSQNCSSIREGFNIVIGLHGGRKF